MACGANLVSDGFLGSDDDGVAGSSRRTSGLGSGCNDGYCGAAVGMGFKSNSDSNSQVLGVFCKGFCIWSIHVIMLVVMLVIDQYDDSGCG